MKKIITGFCILALAASLVVILTAGIGPEKKKAVAVTLSADTAFTAVSRTSAAETVLAAENLIAASKKSSLKAADAAELARLGFTYEDDTASERIVYKKDALLYISDGKKLREIPAADFYALADQISRNFYTLRPIPKASIDSFSIIIEKSEYAFEKLDGKFYRAYFDPGAPQDDLVRTGKKLPIPAFSVKPQSVRVTVSSGYAEEALWSGTLAEFENYKPKKTGYYTVRFAATYGQPHMRGEVVYSYYFDYDVEIGFSVDGASTDPGEVVILRAKNIPADAEIIVDTDVNFKPKFFAEENGDRIAFLPVSYYTSPGGHYVQLTCGDVSKKFDIAVKDKKFDIQNMTVSAETADETINSRKANAEYERVIAPLRSVADDRQYWQGRFIWPVKGDRRITTTFATIRYVNGSSNSSRHGAIDIACPTGTPVYASGAGRVIYAGFLQLTGNTVLIEHGYGLKTWHYHMDSLNVKTEDMVTQGQKIGEVGSTGFSTGPHLHFGMTVNNVFVNPETAIVTDLFASKED